MPVIINPATEEVIRIVENDNDQSIKQKYTEALVAFSQWKNESIEYRLEIVRSFYHQLEINKDKCARDLSEETGKPLSQSINEINGARSRILFFLENSKSVLQNELVVNQENLKEIISYEPLGVIGNISAWNYPYLVGVNVFIPALLAGNCVMYKPSEFATLTGLNITSLLEKSGLPKHVFQIIVGEGEAGRELLKLPLAGYYFTGSNATGKYIYEEVSKKMVPCQLELGGKDPLYVHSDVSNPESVAKAAAEGAFYNNGQSCCAVERIYVHETIYNAFVDAFVIEVNSYQVGDPFNAETFIGPVTRQSQLNVLKDQVSDALSKGAGLLTGGRIMDKKGFYFEPTVLSDVNHDMKIMKEESFGPVIGIKAVKDEHEALELMNDTSYGLTASVYSSSENVYESMASQLNSGTVYWNCCDRVSPHVPWAGRKDSGFGLTLSYHGIRAFTKTKSLQKRMG